MLENAFLAPPAEMDGELHTTHKHVFFSIYIYIYTYIPNVNPSDPQMVACSLHVARGHVPSRTYYDITH